MTQDVVYCIDSSALIELRQRYPRAIFPALWQKLSELVRAGRLIAPREVKKEVAKDDELPSWVKHNRRVFVALTAAQVQRVGEILKRFPGLIDPTKEIPDADPFVIALALSENAENLFAKHVVVTMERRSRGTKPKIPDVCTAYGVECIFGSTALTELFEGEGWRFTEVQVRRSSPSSDAS